MKVLLDHCVPRPLRRHLPGHKVITAGAMGWAELNNGALLAVAEGNFDVMITADKNIRYQQNRAGRRLAIILLPTNYFPTVVELAPKIRVALADISPGDWREIEP